MNIIATQRNSFEINWSWAISTPFTIAGLTRKSPMLKVEAKNPNGNAPIPKDIWKPSPNPKLGNVLYSDCSVRCPWGRGGIFFSRGSFLSEPRPYSGITCSRVTALLQTGQVGLIGFVSSHWCKQGQQKRWPHMLTTASLAVSRQMLHSKFDSAPPPPPPAPSFGVADEVDGPLLWSALPEWVAPFVLCSFMIKYRGLRWTPKESRGTVK